MSRGNKREVDRKRAEARGEGKGKTSTLKTAERFVFLKFI